MLNVGRSLKRKDNTMQKGIDISKHQGKIDFLKVANDGIEFAVIRDGYSRREDSRFFANVKGCKRYNIEVLGVYHFSYALSVLDAIEEAKFAVDKVKKAGLGSDTIIFYDFEYDTVDWAKEQGVVLGSEECMLFTQAFCDQVKREGYIPGVYFNGHYMKTMYTAEFLNKYFKWLADWTGTPDYDCDLHQYSSTGKVAGVYGKVDMNYLIEGDVKNKTNDEMIQEIFDGKWGNGIERQTRITKAGYDYVEIQNHLNAIEDLVDDILAGKLGNNPERRAFIIELGYDPDLVQGRVNTQVKD